MRLAMKMPPKKGTGQGNAADTRDDDPRESESAEIIDLASRSAFPAVAGKKGGGDTMGMVAGIAIVAALGLVTLWSMNSARLSPEDTAPAADAAPARDTSPAQVTVDPAPTQASPGTPQQVVRVDPAPTPILSNNPNYAQGPATNTNNSPMIVFDSSGRAVATVPAAALPEGPGTDGEVVAGGSASDFACLSLIHI